MVFQQYEKLRDVYSLRSDLKKQNLEIDLISMLHKVCEKRMSCVKKKITPTSKSASMKLYEILICSLYTSQENILTETL